MNEHAETVLSAHTATSPEVNTSAVTELNNGVTPRMEVKNLHFYYSKDAEPALKNINMPIYNNRVTALIGPSGCGKSTLLRTMNRIYDLYGTQHTEGDILLDGENIFQKNVDLNLLRSKVGMVFQKPTPFPMSIYDNITFGLKMQGKLSAPQMAVRAKKALKRAHLWKEVKDEGDILLDGQNIFQKNVDLNLLRSKVGMVFQKPTPFPMSIYDNITFGLKMQGKLSAPQMAVRAKKALKRAHLWKEVKDKLNADASGLSGGQQQRLCIARTIALKPEVILMDEPTSALDPLATAAIEELITELREKYTIVIVTHNMQQAMRISDYTGFMYLGELMEFGPTDKIFHHADHQKTRDYIAGNFG